VTDVEGSVGARNRERCRCRWFANELVVGGGRGVGPCAGGVDGEGAVAAHGAGLRHEGGGESTSEMVSVPLVESVRGQIGLGSGWPSQTRGSRRRWCPGY